MIRKKIVKIKTIYGTHEIALEKDKKGYTVTAPGLKGVVTWGESITKAKKMAREAVELHIECIAEEELVKSGDIKRNRKRVYTKV